MRVFIEGSCRSNSRRSAPGEVAQAREERLAGLEHLESGPAKRLMEFGGAEVAMLTLAEELEGDRRQEPPQRLNGGAEPLRLPHRLERRDHPRRPIVGQEDRMAARLERAAAALQQRAGIRMPVQRVHAHQDVEAAGPGERGLRDVEVLEGETGAAGPVLLARDLDQV